MSVAMTLAVFAGGGDRLSWGIILLLGATPLWMAMLMAAPFHYAYLIENWDTRLIIDDIAKTITIEDKTGDVTYNVKELFIESNTAIYLYDYGHPSPSKYYGYLKIKTIDNRSFYITSLMIDPHDFLLPINDIKSRIPSLYKLEPADEWRLNELYKKQKIEEYVERFSKLSNGTLEEKVNNPKRYEAEAVKAAELILKERKDVVK